MVTASSIVSRPWRGAAAGAAGCAPAPAAVTTVNNNATTTIRFALIMRASSRWLRSGDSALCGGNDTREQNGCALGFGFRDEDDDFALRADGERMHRVGDARPQQHRNAFALEQALHHHRLRVIAAAHLGESFVRNGAGAARRGREGDD